MGWDGGVGRGPCGLGAFAAQQGLHGFHGGGNQSVLRVTDGGQRDAEIFAGENIAEADDREVLGNAEALVEKSFGGADGDEVVDGLHGGRAGAFLGELEGRWFPSRAVGAGPHTKAAGVVGLDLSEARLKMAALVARAQAEEPRFAELAHDYAASGFSEEQAKNTPAMRRQRLPGTQPDAPCTALPERRTGTHRVGATAAPALVARRGVRAAIQRSFTCPCSRRSSRCESRDRRR